MSKTILVVEDNETNRTLMRDILTYYKYAVIEAENGEIGLQLAIEHVPDLILMDIQMPIMNGYTATTLLKNDPRTKDIKILAVTSFAMAGDRERVLASGADGYISKPINTRELPTIIEELIRK